jgi:signal transduction histidine kinase
MKTCPLPQNEELRLATLASCHILDTPPEKEFDELVELLVQIFGCAFATISFMDRDRQWFKSSVGLTDMQAPRNDTFCTHTILDGQILLVDDTTLDPRFADHPAVTGAPMVRFYAGVPIVSSDGYNLGTVCVFDQQPGHTTEGQKRALTIIAAQVTRLLELRLHNKAIRKQANRQIDMEKKTIQYTLRRHEEENQSIGVELHENFGQVLSACSLYLNMAEELQQDGQHFLAKARMELGKLINDVRRLSRHVNPMSLHEVDFKEVLTESVEGVHLHSSLKTRLVFKGSSSHLPASQALTLLRVIIQYLELLGTKKDISLITIELSMFRNVRLSICYDTAKPPRFSLFEQVTINALINRVELEEGTIHFSDTGVEVRLPETQPEMA